MRLSFCLVGGIYNPIILVDQPEAEDLVRLFRVDMLEVVGADRRANEFVSLFPYLKRPIHGDLFDRAQRRTFSSCQLLDVINGIHVWSEWSNWEDSVGRESGLKRINWSPEDPLADVFLAEFGGYPEEKIIGDDYELDVSRYLPKYDVPKILIDPSKPLVDALSSRHTAATFFADRGITWDYPGDRGWFFPGIYLGDGSRVADLARFWNLRAANMPVRFVDHNRLDRFAILAPALTGRTRQHIRSLPEPRNVPAIWTTDETLATALAPQIAPRGPFNLCRLDEFSWRGGSINVPSMYLSETSALGVEAKTRVSFSLPDRPYATDDYSNQHLIASVKIQDPTFGSDKRETFGLPYLPEHNEAFARALGVIYDQLRIEPDRLGLVIDAGSSDKSVQAMPVWDLATTLFRAAGLRAKLSNGGLITQQLVSQLGGFEGGRVFKIPGVRRLLRTFSATESFTKNAALRLIGERDPDTGASFADHHQLFIEPRDTSLNLTCDMVFSYLAAKGVVRLGWDLACPRCQLKDWVPLDQLRQHHTCSYCGEGYDATRQLVETPMVFRRSGLLGIQRDAQGAIPVALVLQQLANNLSHLGNDALLLPSIKLEDGGPGGFKCETDLFGIFPRTYPSRPAVLIGECKDREGRIDAEDVKKLGTLGERLGASGMEVYFLFAKLGAFSDEEIQLVRALNGKWQHRVILLTGQELEPYHLYDRHTEEQGGRLFGSRLPDLALNSERIFPGLRADPSDG